MTQTIKNIEDTLKENYVLEKVQIFLNQHLVF